MPDPSPRKIASARIEGPVATQLRRAGVISVAAGLVWPVQAALVAWVIAGWLDAAPYRDTMLAAAGFVLLALLRAGLDRRAARILFDAADRTIARERALILATEARGRGPQGSAEIAALLGQKLPLLQPWITRYRVAMLRVSVLPLALALIVLTQSWVAALILLISGPLIPVFMALVGMAAEDASRRHLAEIGSVNALLMERLAALTDIRLLGATGRVEADFAARADDLRERTMAVLRIAFLSSSVLELFAALGVAMMAVFVGFTLLGEIGIGSWGGLSVGQGVFLLLIAPEFYQPMRDLAAAWHDRAAGLAVVEELRTVEAAPRIAFLGTGAVARPLPGAFSLRVQGAQARGVALPDLAITAGQSLALTGPSGVGKTTTLEVISGLVLAEGRIEICGQALDDATADGWRARIALVPQAVHFPDMPLRDWLDLRGTGGDPWPALELAGAADLVEALPRGLDTHLGETGGGLSGGEARRLMLARAICGGGDLLIADEPTADLDPETAARIIATLASLQAEGMAILVATHDARLADAMDRRIALT